MTDAPARPRRLSSRRHQSRRLALQAVYQWLISDTGLEDLRRQFRDEQGYANCDQDYFDILLRGVLANRAELEQAFAGYLDRPVAQLDPVEHAVLLLAAYELGHHPELPYRVAINEAVELAKVFGAEESHKYINGVMDRLAHSLRAVEIAAG
jgi:N utilization substance protein B